MAELPHKIAVLCDLRDPDGRILLIHRAKEPNKGLYSPIGGKLETAVGESPAQCAQREIFEESGVEIPIHRLHLAGIVSEKGYEGRTHWLIFVYRVLGAVSVEKRTISEGELHWKTPVDLKCLPVPETDRRIIWPLIFEHEGGFFAVHIDCSDGELTWTIEQPLSDRTTLGR